MALAFVPAGPGVMQLPACNPAHATHVTLPPKPDVTQLPAPRPSPHVPFVGTHLSPHIAFVNTRPHPHAAFVDTGYYLRVAFVDTRPHPHVVCPVSVHRLCRVTAPPTRGLDTGFVPPSFVCLRELDNPDSVRDATFIKFTLDVDKNQNHRNLPVVLQRKAFVGKVHKSIALTVSADFPARCDADDEEYAESTRE
ncbi:hypothetical protein DFH07DRAFT_963601 [Mycena maculata]|uniref:Uncharacterized protein n=1 Tax=Mycena maculata TaxID=230809 RepID=A0AAD7N450_9AGAR|nr:hypothetical protein DFH07DRAFT_963601 [Mycena maculata]